MNKSKTTVRLLRGIKCLRITPPTRSSHHLFVPLALYSTSRLLQIPRICSRITLKSSRAFSRGSRVNISRSLKQDFPTSVSTMAISDISNQVQAAHRGAVSVSAAARPDDLKTYSTTRDLRKTKLWSEIESHHDNMLRPGYGQVSSASDLHFPPGLISSSGLEGGHTKIVFTGNIYELIDDVPTGTSRICTADIKTGEVQRITGGGGGPKGGNDRSAKWRPDGKQIAFLSDRETKGIFGVYILDVGGFGEARRIKFSTEDEETAETSQDLKDSSLSPSEASAEWLQWSTDGNKLLVGLAGQDADAGDAAGSGKVGGDQADIPAWMPSVESDVKESQFRTLAVWDGNGQYLKPLTLAQGKPINVWEASWCGPNKIIALVSDTPGEEAWYLADLVLYDLTKGTSTKVNGLRDQHCLPLGSPSGKRWAAIQSIASDRGLVNGDLVLGEADQDTARVLELGADVGHLAWKDDDTLVYMGTNGLDSVVGEVYIGKDMKTSQKEIWSTPESTSIGWHPEGTLLPDSAIGFVLSSWTRAPEIGTLNKGGEYQTLNSFSHKGSEHIKSILGTQEAISWKAPDGLEIQGYLQTPRTGQAPFPLILHVHGGPCASWRNAWSSTASIAALLNSRGYAILWTNPRGSTGRGQSYTSQILGDVGGKETQDHLSGIDALVEKGIADPDRIGVIGGSHGGFMASWIITQDARFKASVPMSAVTDWHSMHTTTNINVFTRLFLKADPYSVQTDRSLSFLTRSPVMHANRTKTPVLQLAGSNDLCVHPSQGVQFHNALKEHGVESSLMIYPGEGHGIRNFPAIIDGNVRTVAWFERFMPAK